MSLPPALAQYVASAITHVPTSRNLWIAAAFFSLVSVGCVFLVFVVARRAGADEREALIAAALLAASSTLTVWSRHLSPYDAALFFNLWAIAIGLSAERSAWRWTAAGFAAAMGLMTYNGVWAGTAVVLILLVLYRARSTREAIVRGLLAAGGFALLVMLIHVVSIAVGAFPFVKSLTRFSGRISEGDMREGWSLPWAFLWHAEHGVLLVWLGGAVLALFNARRLDPSARMRTHLWIAMAAGVYVLLVVGSVGAGRFVVHGRSVHPLLPFLCLAAATGFRSLTWPPRRRVLAWSAAALVVIQVGWNLRIPLQQTFPSDFRERALARYPSAAVAYSIDVGHNVVPADARYLLVNADYLYPVRGLAALPRSEQLMSAPHPQAYLPYQYEGFTPSERAFFRAEDLTMRVDRVLR